VAIKAHGYSPAMEYTPRILALLFLASGCAGSSPQPAIQQQPATQPQPATQQQPAGHMRAVLVGHPELARLEADEELSQQFKRYWRWIAEDVGTPDAQYLASLPGDDLELEAFLFHEKIEFESWIKLGHRPEDIMQVEYFQQNYEAVYPIAHRDATRAEMELLTYFAGTIGLDVPPLALVLVCPMVERREGATAERMVRRLKFNPEYASQEVTPEDLEAATKVWEAGNYSYRDRSNVVAEALAYVNGRR
jgi:hypothetical protein